MKFIQPKIELVQSISSSTPMYQWMKTRPMLNRSWKEITFDEVDSLEDTDTIMVGNKPRNWKEYKDEVLKLGLQYCNSGYYIFELDCSILFRDFLFNCNESACWADTNRKFPADFKQFDYEHYPMSGEYSSRESLKSAVDLYLSDINDQVARGVTELNRDKLPMAMSTHIFFGASLTQITSLINVMKKYFPLFDEAYGSLFRKLVVPTSSTFISDEHIKYLGLPSESIGIESAPLDMKVLTANMSYSIHAQFLRHKSSFTIGYWNKLRSLMEDDILPLYGDEITVSSLMPSHRLNSMISTRTCAFSQSMGNGINSWSHIMNIVASQMTYDQFIGYLPCHGCRNSCRFYEDICARDENATEKESQCPILIGDATQFKLDRQNRLGDYYYKLVNEDKTCTMKCGPCKLSKRNYKL